MAGKDGERFTGHGSEWTDAKLSTNDAQVATVWVEQIVNKRSMLTNKDRVEDVRDIMWDLEKDGEIVVHRVTDEHDPVTVKTLYGWEISDMYTSLLEIYAGEDQDDFRLIQAELADHVEELHETLQSFSLGNL